MPCDQVPLLTQSNPRAMIWPRISVIGYPQLLSFLAGRLFCALHRIAMLAGSTLSTAVIALFLGAIGVVFSVLNLYVAARNRRLDEEDRREQRAAELSYKYSKEIQVRQKPYPREVHNR